MKPDLITIEGRRYVVFPAEEFFRRMKQAGDPQRQEQGDVAETPIPSEQAKRDGIAGHTSTRTHDPS